MYEFKVDGAINQLGAIGTIRVTIDKDVGLSIGCTYSTLRDDGLACRVGGLDEGKKGGKHEKRCSHFLGFTADCGQDVGDSEYVMFGRICCDCEHWKGVANTNPHQARGW